LKHQFPFALIVFAALISSAPAVHSQSKTDCAPQQRKELIVTVVDPSHSIIDSLRAEHFTLKVGNAKAIITDASFHFNNEPVDAG